MRNRGNDKKALFDSPRDFERFLELVAWAKHQVPLRMIAYCLMTNHWHFVVWPIETGAVERFMQRLETTHAIRRRFKTQTVGHGHIYQDRYRASIVDSESYYWNVLSYVEGNALRSRLVRAAEHWRWSSLHERLNRPRHIIDDGPFALPDQWPEIVNQSLPEETIREIRSALWKQRRTCNGVTPRCVSKIAAKGDVTVPDPVTTTMACDPFVRGL